MALPPPQGQDPLAALPQYGGRGGGQQAGQYYAGQEFSKLFGRNPTQSELDQFSNYYLGADPNIANVAGGNQAISSYFNQQQQAANAPQNEAKALQDQIPIISNLVKNQTSAIGEDLMNPNSPTYRQFSGLMNNMGIDPSSGAFQSGLGGTLGANAAQAENSALGAVGLPIAQGYSQGAMAPFNQAMSQPQDLFTHGLQMQDFIAQSQLANQLAEKGKPSGAQSAMGMASGAASGAGNLAQGGAQAYSATSYVCKELIKRGLLCESDMDDFHIHIMPAMFRKGRAFWKYAADGLNLVNAVNAKGLDWKVFKPLLFDRVMDESDACRAVDLYADACHQLCISSDRSLWDERVYRTSFSDSLIFLPRLLFYRPFMEAFWKCLRIKMMIVYDKPHCVVHK